MYRGISLKRNSAPPQDPTVGIGLGPCGDPRGGVAVSYERGTPVQQAHAHPGGGQFLRSEVPLYPCLGVPHV